LTGVKTGVDCLFCQEIDALNSKFDNENIHCITQRKYSLHYTLDRIYNSLYKQISFGKCTNWTL